MHLITAFRLYGRAIDVAAAYNTKGFYTETGYGEVK
jgi:hypothetical protein